MLEGKNVNLRIVEQEDLKLVAEWMNNPEFTGEYEPIQQESKTDLEKQYNSLHPEERWFFVEKKDGAKVGIITHFLAKGKLVGIGYYLLPNEREKGYGSDAVKIMVDYLFLSKDIVRVQAETHPENKASQRVLEKAGFSKEGIIRKAFFSRGTFRDTVLFSILRDEWKKQKLSLKKAQ